MNTLKTNVPLLTVSQLNQAIRLNLESMFPNICLQGEISNLKLQSSGHLYFTLKDADSQIQAVMFQRDLAGLKMMPKVGDQVMVKAQITVYTPKGNYQLNIRELSYVGLGDLLQKLEELKIKLHKMGWFKAARKKALPKFPKRIGVVTSPTGAVIQDILHILSRRFSGFHLILNPVKVQGEGAAQEIAQAIRQFNQHQLVDVLIIGRGGGSLEDLWAFNEEIVAQAVYDSQIPIICAVGHESDHCIAEYVADVRAPTPSAAAEIVIAEKEHFLDKLQNFKKQMQQKIKNQIHNYQIRLESCLKQPLLINPYRMLELRMQKLDDVKQEMDRSMFLCMQSKKQALLSRTRQAMALKPINQITHFKHRLKDREQSLLHAIQKKTLHYIQSLGQAVKALDQTWQKQQTQRHHQLDKDRLIRRLDQLIIDRYQQDRQKLVNIERLLQSSDPKNLLNKGYSILFAEKEPFIINSVEQLKAGQVGRLMLSDGELLITINKIISRGN